MKVRFEMVARATVDIEVDDAQKRKLQNLECPVDLSELEGLLDLDIDTTDIFETSHIEVDDVEFLPEYKPRSHEHEPL